MYTTSKFARPVVMFVFALLTVHTFALADEPTADPSSVAQSEAHEQGPFNGRLRNLRQKMARHTGGFGKQTVRRLKLVGQRVANHMIANPGDLDQIDEIAGAVIESAPQMLIQEAQDAKNAAASDAVREAVETVTRLAGQ
jgi:hypothetical protein